MKYKISVKPRTFHFKQPAGTSRGVYTTRKSWFVEITSDEYPGRKGIGECAPLPDLSCDFCPEYEQTLNSICGIIEATGQINYEMLRPYPSIMFGIETAIRHLQCGNLCLEDTPFGRGEEGIPTNGLVWMGSFEEMSQRLEQKIEDGFKCIKLKIGAIDFEKELELVKCIRSRFSKNDIELRLDANGGFTPQNAKERLDRLARYDIHSIEQPIKQHQWREMAALCASSPIPIALDEELIGVNLSAMKDDLLDTIRPAYIILKPSLHGGMKGSAEWIAKARQRGIGSWMTSALESNVGLNAIAHLAAHIYGPDIKMPQGLGTGMLFTDNIDFPIALRGNRLWFTPEEAEWHNIHTHDNDTARILPTME